MTAQRNKLLRRTASTVALVAAGVALAVPGTAGAAPCASSGPASGAYAVNICVSAPSDGATVSGDTTASATASVTGTNPGVQRVVFYLDDQQLLTDYQSPYTFELPTEQFVDGTRTLSAETLMRDAFVSSRASVSLTFSNGVASPPVAGTGFVPRVGTPAAPGMPFVVGAAGDGASGETSSENVSDEILSWDPNLFLYLGDVYEKGSGTEFRNWYGSPTQSWGRLRDITNPVLGDHEDSGPAGAPGYDAYWGTPPRYFSYDAGGWHFIQLNTLGTFDQTMPGTPQYEWLVADLAANSSTCTLVYQHDPVFSVGAQGDHAELLPFWSQFASAGVDVVLTANDHNYQRWLPMNAFGAFDPSGITQFVVGTGGHGIRPFSRTDARLAAGFDTSPAAFGALRLQLNTEGAGYQFVTTDGQVADSGTIGCSGAGADTTPPDAPSDLSASAPSSTQVDLTWTEATDNVGIASYDILRDGAVLTTVEPRASYTDASVAPSTTYAYSVLARDSNGNVSAATAEVLVTTPPRAALFADDFESGTFANWTFSTGLTIDTADVLGGGHAARSTTAGTIAYARKNLATPQTELFLETQFKVRSQGANTFQILRVRTASGLRLAKFFLSSTGKLGYTNEVTATSRTSTVAPARGAWHTLELQVVVSEIDSRIAVWLDGIPVTALTQPEALGTAAIGQIELGNSSAVTADASFDNVFADGSRTLDTTAPSTPTDFAATPLSGLAVRLDWTAATDNVAVTAYDVFRGGQLIASVGSTTYTDTSATPHSTATYTVRARDGSGNQSFASSPATAVTGAIFSTGFETGNLAGWTSAVSMSVQTTDVPTGAYAAEAASSSPSYGYRQLERGVADIWFGARVKIVSQGPSSVNLLQLRTETGAAISTVFVTGTGRLATRNDVTGVTTQSTTVLARGSWYFVQVHALQNGASGALEIVLDGAGVADLSRTDDLGVVPIRRVLVGDTNGDRVFVLRLDDVFADTVAAPDTSPPSAPTGLVATAPNALRVDLSWSAATDGVGVTGYDVYRGGVRVGSAPGTTFTDTTAQPGVLSTYSVRARDAAGNVGPASNAATATPPAELLFSDGFESGDMSLWSDAPGMTAQSVSVATGAFAARAQASESGGYAKHTLASTEQQLDLRAKFRLEGFSAQTTVLKARLETGMSMASVSVSSSGKLVMRNDIASDSMTSDTQVLPGWHDLQLHLDVDAGVIDVYLDNQRVPDLSGPQSLGTAGIERIEIGDRDLETFDLSVDDVAVSGDAGRDRTPPSAPSALTAVAPTGIAVQLVWSAASDVGSGVAGYDVFRDGSLVASVGNVTSHLDLTAAPHSNYVYEVAARDGGGNASPHSAPVSISTGAVVESGFETGDLSEWTSISGLVVAPEHAGAGSYGALATSTGAAARAYRQLPRGLNDVYARLGFRPVTQGANSVNLLRFRNGTGGAIASVFVTNIGRVGIRNDVSGITTVSTVAIQPGAWNELQARVVVSGAAGQVQVWLNGAPVAALDRTEDFGTTPVQRLEIFDSATGRAFSFAGDQFRADTSFIPEGTPPAPPTNVTVGLASALRAQVSWEASADPSGIASYSLYRDGVLLATQSGTSYVDVDVVPGATHAYSVVARDGNGNESARSAPTGSTVPAAAIADGFELGLGGWVNDGLTLQASHVRTGGFAARGESTGAATWAHRDLAADRGEVDARLSFDVQAAVSVNLLKLRARPSSSGSSGATILTIFRSSSGRLGLRNENTSVSTISNDKIGSGWHTVQVHAIVGDPTGLVEVWLDGRPVPELTAPQALGTRPVGRLQIGENSTGKTYLFDLDDLYLDNPLGG